MMPQKRHHGTPRVSRHCFSGAGVSTAKSSAAEANQAGAKQLLEWKARTQPQPDSARISIDLAQHHQPTIAGDVSAFKVALNLPAF